MTEELIRSCQSELNHYITSRKDKAVYEEIIPNLVDKLIKQLKSEQPNSWPSRTSIIKPVDIYIEALSKLIIDSTNLSNIPTRILAFVIIDKPYIINTLQEKHNLDSWVVLSQELADIIEKNYSSYPNSKMLIETLKSTPNLKDVTAFTKFNYLLGFNFDKLNVSLTYNDLHTKVLELNPDLLILINSSYNLNNLESIVLYHEPERIPQKILFDEYIDKSNSIIIPEKIYKSATPYTLYNKDFKTLQEPTKEYKTALVVIDYNDAEDITNRHFTIAFYGNNKLLRDNEIFDFLAYNVLSSPNHDDLMKFLKESFYSAIYSNDLEIEKLKVTYTKLMNIAARNYDTKDYINAIVEEALKEEIIHKEEEKFFKIYLFKLKEYKFEENKEGFIEHVINYIYPDLLTNSSEILTQY